jgi:hypothetical protein
MTTQPTQLEKPGRIRAHVASLRKWAAELEAEAQRRYVRNFSGDKPIPPEQ